MIFILESYYINHQRTYFLFQQISPPEINNPVQSDTEINIHVTSPVSTFNNTYNISFDTAKKHKKTEIYKILQYSSALFLKFSFNANIAGL